MTMDSLISSPKATHEEDQMIQAAGKEVGEFVRRRWAEREWETAWFVNPPVGSFESCIVCIAMVLIGVCQQRLQSVPDLSHIHVFARRKSAQDIDYAGAADGEPQKGREIVSRTTSCEIRL